MKRWNEQGFSLVESILHLLIFSMLVQFTVVYFYWQAPVERVYQGDLLGEWELFSLEMQEMLEEVTVVGEIKPKQFTFDNGRGKISIQHYDNMLRKVVDGHGHVPLLMNVRSSHFSMHGNELKLTVELLDGMRKERTFAIGIHPQ